VAPAEPAPADSAPTMGVSNAAADSVASLMDKARASTRDPQAAEREYDRRHVGFGRLTLVNLSGVAVGYLDQAYEGQTARQPLSLPEFYDKVDRPDLRRAYERRRQLYFGLFIPGALVAATGALLTTFGAMEPYCSSFSKQPCPGRNMEMLGAGIALDIVGLGAMIAGFVNFPSRPAEAEMRQLADDHNRRVRRELGLTSVSLAPHANGLSLAASGRF
jgi:hypothetical protein